MSSSDVFVRLLLNTDGFQDRLNTARKGVDKFKKDTEKGAVTAGELGAALGKMATRVAAGMGITMGAMEAFNKVMTSSQELGDEYAATMESAKASVDQFFHSLGRGEFNSFLDGMQDIITSAREAYFALDQLGNTKISFGVRSAEIGANIADAQYLAKNKFAPMDKRIEGFSAWRENLVNLEGITGTLQADLVKAITKSVEKEIGSNSIKVSLADVDEVWDIDLTNPEARAELKGRYSNAYDAYTTRKEYLLKEQKGTLDEGRLAGIAVELQELDSIYHDAIVVNAMLNKYTDEELQNLAQLNTEYHQLRGTLSNMGREFNETAVEFNNANKSIAGFTSVKGLDGYDVFTGTSEIAHNFATGVKSQTTEAIKGSLNALDGAIKAKQEEFANAATDAARIAAQKAINELKAQRHEILITVRMATEEVDAPDSMGEIKKTFADMAKMPDFKGTKLSMPTSGIKKATSDYQELGDTLSNISGLMGAFGSITQGSTNDMITWASSSLQAIAQVIAATSALIPVKKTEANANAEVAVTGAAASAASTPIVGWLMAGAAVAAVIAAMASIPKFADGGIVGGSSYFGDKILARLNSGELVLNQTQQSKLYNHLTAQEAPPTKIEVAGQAHVSGKELFIAIRNYMAATGTRFPK